MNILVRIAYYGQSFYGSQKQPNYVTIQGLFEKVLSRIYDEKIKITICSRLDRGVHAFDFAFSFKPSRDDITLSHLKYYLIRSVPNDIFIKDVVQVADDFSPRYDCLSKQYLYLIQNREIRNPIYNPFSYSPAKPLNIDLIKSTLSLFQGEHNFVCFSSPEGDENTILTIDKVSFEDDNGILSLRFIGKSFLRYQVRFMVGACISVALSRITLNQVFEMLKGIPNTKTKYKAEPQGLILEHIEYPNLIDTSPIPFFLPKF